MPKVCRLLFSANVILTSYAINIARLDDLGVFRAEMVTLHLACGNNDGRQLL